MIDALPDGQARLAFIRTLRTAVDWRGQVVTMLDRCYLDGGMPTLLIWGDRDGVIPVAHAYQAHDAMPGSRLEIFEGAGHFPHHADPERFVDVIDRFLGSTEPAHHRNRGGANAPPRSSERLRRVRHGEGGDGRRRARSLRRLTPVCAGDERYGLAGSVPDRYNAHMTTGSPHATEAGRPRRCSPTTTS